MMSMGVLSTNSAHCPWVVLVDEQSCTTREFEKYIATADHTSSGSGNCESRYTASRL